MYLMWTPSEPCPNLPLAEQAEFDNSKSIHLSGCQLRFEAENEFRTKVRGAKRPRLRHCEQAERYARS
jgi:hypothetical protein